jgi:hypothetical protein
MYHFATYKTVTIFYVIKILNASVLYKFIKLNFLKELGIELA